MPPTNKLDYEKIADFLTHGKPMAHAVRFDGSLSVVAANGQKFIFSKEEVDQAQEELKALAIPSRKAPGRPRKAQEPKKTG